MDMGYRSREQLISDVEELQTVLEGIYAEANSDTPDIDKILDLAADGLEEEGEEIEEED